VLELIAHDRQNRPVVGGDRSVSGNLLRSIPPDQQAVGQCPDGAGEAGMNPPLPGRKETGRHPPATRGEAGQQCGEFGFDWLKGTETEFPDHMPGKLDVASGDAAFGINVIERRFDEIGKLHGLFPIATDACVRCKPGPRSVDRTEAGRVGSGGRSTGVERVQVNIRLREKRLTGRGEYSGNALAFERVKRMAGPCHGPANPDRREG